MLMPFRGLVALAAGVRRSPIRLLKAVTEVPPEISRPLTIPPGAFSWRLHTLFREAVTLVPPVMESPVTVEVAPVDAKVLMLLPVMTELVAEEASPMIVAVEERPLTELPVRLVLVDGEAQLIPVTVPPVPLDVRLEIVLLFTA